MADELSLGQGLHTFHLSSYFFFGHNSLLLYRFYEFWIAGDVPRRRRLKKNQRPPITAITMKIGTSKYLISPIINSK
jgi:hypothetical protein